MVHELLVSLMYKYDVIYTITSITVHQSGAYYDMSIEYNTPTPVQSRQTDTKYNTIPNSIQAQYCEESHSRKIQIPKLHAPELPSEETHEAREGERGLAPWWPPAIGRCATTKRGQGGGRPRGEGKGEWKRVVMVFVVGGNEGVGLGRRNEKKVEGGDDDGDVGC